MTNVYNRNLLSFVPWERISQLLEDAISWLADNAGPQGLNQPLISSIHLRLILRRDMLHAVGSDICGLPSEHRSRWQSVSKSLALVSATQDQGVYVKDAFSGKIQRQLASTTPPRPIINLSFAEAREYLTRLCKHAEEIYGIIDCARPSNALVSH